MIHGFKPLVFVHIPCFFLTLRHHCVFFYQCLSTTFTDSVDEKSPLGRYRSVQYPLEKLMESTQTLDLKECLLISDKINSSVIIANHVDSKIPLFNVSTFAGEKRQQWITHHRASTTMGINPCRVPQSSLHWPCCDPVIWGNIWGYVWHTDPEKGPRLI